MTTLSITGERATRISDQIQRITDFFSRQDDFTDAFVVWDADRQIMAQVLPDAKAALAACREALRLQQVSIASNQERARMSSTSARLVRLDSQVRACVRALKNSGVQFVLAWQIAGDVAHLDYATNLSPRFIVEHVIATLDQGGRCRPHRATLASAPLTLCNR